MKVINLFGGPGSGKSGIAAGVYSKLRKQGISIELVREYAKELYYQERLKLMLEFQEVLYTEQNVRQQSLIDKVDYVITDSPILLSAVYPDINRDLFTLKPWPALHEFKALVRAQFACYDNLNIWLERPEKYEQAGRLQDEKQARWIDEMIWSEVQERQITRLKLNDDTESNVIAMILSETINT